MGLAYVKINQISGMKFDKGARYELSATLSSDNSIVTPVLFHVKKDDINLYLTSDNVWMLPYEVNSKDDSISITLVEGKKKYKKIATLILPLKWFPPDTVVHESYPMHQIEENEKEKRKIFADVNVHLSTKGTDPFHAPPGQLLVRPMWVSPNAPPPPPPQPQPVGYIPNQCRPPQFAYNNAMYQRPQMPIGVPPIRAGPAPQIFTQQLPPSPYPGYMNAPQPIPQPTPQPMPQQSYQPQVQPSPQQNHQLHTIPADKETSSSDDGLDNLGLHQNTNTSANTNHSNNNQSANQNHDSRFDLQPEDYISVRPVTNNQTYDPNTH